jgi:hypothetical protein
MELVVLENVVASYATLWLRVANTEGYDKVRVGDEFKPAGALEILGVENVDPSPVAGASRIRFRRGEHATPVEIHRMGSVLTRTLSIAEANQAVTAVKTRQRAKVGLPDLLESF